MEPYLIVLKYIQLYSIKQRFYGGIIHMEKSQLPNCQQYLTTPFIKS
jgi:hypothetical protein